MAVVWVLAGWLLVLLALVEAFEVLVLPRRVNRPFKFSRVYYRTGWRVWGAASEYIRSARARQTFLSLFGPLSLLLLFAVWAAELVVGFTFLHHALDPRDGGLAESLYLSGVTFTTVGYGDVAPRTPWTRAVAVAEGATGFGFFAVVITYLPVLNQAFGRRESFIGRLDARAGSPPAAGRMLLRVPPTDDRCWDDFLAEAERWAAELLEGHLSFPVLGYYRSQHDNQSWLCALTCVLDATALLLTVTDGVDRTRARLTFAMARHTLVDLGLVMRKGLPPQIDDRLPPERLAELLAALRSAGVAVKDDEAARKRLAELRGLYEPVVVGLARFYRVAVPDVWPTEEKPDNWQTSAWLRRADPLTALGDDHFDGGE